MRVLSAIGAISVLNGSAGHLLVSAAVSKPPMCPDGHGDVQFCTHPRLNVESYQMRAAARPCEAAICRRSRPPAMALSAAPGDLMFLPAAIKMKRA